MTVPEVPDDIRISVSLLGMLADIRKEQTTGFARLEVSMSGKADKADVARMEARLDAHGKALDEQRTHISELQIKAREDERAAAAAATANEWWRTRFGKAGGFVVGCALVVPSVLAVVSLFH